MYATGYIFRIPLEHVEEFVSIQKAARAIYLNYGAKRDEVYRILTDSEPRYGSLALTDILPLDNGETVFFEIVTFADKEEYDKLTPALDNDEEVNRLFQRLTAIVDIQRIIRFEMPAISGGDTDGIS